VATVVVAVRIVRNHAEPTRGLNSLFELITNPVMRSILVSDLEPPYGIEP
jgi:hypothetical protein